MKKVFIDGSAGTTGLRIHERLEARTDIEVTTLPEEARKDPQARKAAMNASDIVFLCLPDDAAAEAVTFVENSDTAVIDTSTAHRTAPGWAYGFPELSPETEEAIRTAKRIAVPGCHATGFLSLVYPLIEAELIGKEAALTCHSVTGYSGGGRKMIAQYEAENRDALFAAPRQYGLAQRHKHLAEMKAVAGLEKEPAFCPIVADFYSGMETTVPLFKEYLKYGGAEEIRDVYRKKYAGPVVRYAEEPDEDGFLSANALSGRDLLEVSVFGNDERILLVSRFDNLGKGASGAAVECMNLLLGADKKTGLVL
ncbi:MAG TPA: N-acetyl-gamma-glutamyl-phosphate reductase [Oscillospiraceae bacterium]|nr:N-acetyl-gamma-glutamyl-phosphate reductase [Oscillospiraceae bacterium]HXK78162.1 N-acetyl-gamma-glutamyl-phosphate reductase [Oscillospiraceae bacterium]